MSCALSSRTCSLTHPISPPTGFVLSGARDKSRRSRTYYWSARMGMGIEIRMPMLNGCAYDAYALARPAALIHAADMAIQNHL